MQHRVCIFAGADIVLASHACKIASMLNWDDSRIFLAVARLGSLQKAAKALGINRTTVLRRVTAFEESLGARLFERQPEGYLATAAGEEMLLAAEKMEQVIIAAERKISGSDNELSGRIRLTMPAPIATHLLLPDIAQFAQMHEGITFDLLTSNAMADLKRSEADVAIRMSNNPPTDLVGRSIGVVAHAAFVSKVLVSDNGTFEHLERLSWITWSEGQSSKHWIEKSDYPELGVGSVINDPQVSLEAVRAGLGMAMLPCFMGDPDPDLMRMPPGNLHLKTDLWVLTHADLRKTARISHFMRFIANAVKKHHKLLEGRSPAQC